MANVTAQTLLETAISNFGLNLSEAQTNNLRNIIQAAIDRDDDVGLSLLGSVQVRDALEAEYGDLTGSALSQATQRLEDVRQEAEDIDAQPDEPTELTFSDALAIIDDEAAELPERYTITADESATDAGAVSVEQAQARLTQIDALLAGAENADEFTGDAFDLGTLFTWQVDDSAENILALINATPAEGEDAPDTTAVTGADTVTVTDDSVTLAQFEALSALENYQRGEESVAYTLQEALDIEADAEAELDANFILRSDVAPISQEVDLGEANDLLDFIATAGNAEALNAGDLVEWNLIDDAATLINALDTSAVTEAASVSVTNDVVTQTQFDALIALGNFEQGDVEIALTIAEFEQAVADNNGVPPVEYAIAPPPASTVTDAGDVTVTQAEDAYTDLAEILNGASNSADLEVDAFLNWNIVDDAANVIADIDASWVTEADAVSVTDETLSNEDAQALAALNNFTGAPAITPEFGDPVVTESVAATTGAPTEFTITAAGATFETASQLSIQQDGAEVVSVTFSSLSSAGDVATQLNADPEFDQAGFSAAYDNGVLTVTDSEGRSFTGSDVQLLDQPDPVAPSTASVRLLQSSLIDTDTVRLTLGGEEVVLRGIDASTASGAAGAIQTAMSNAGIQDVSVEWDGADTLTLSDDQRREFSNVQLLRQDEDSSVEFTLPSNVGDVAQIEITIDGVSETVDLTGVVLDSSNNDGSTNNAVADAIADEFAGIDVGDLTSTVANDVLTITDTEGRPFGAESQLLNDGDDAVASVTRIGPLTDSVVANDVGQISITIGDETVELANVSETTMQDLAIFIEGQFDSSVTAEVDNGEIVITDAAGRGISDVYVGEAITNQQASTAEISGLTDATAELADTLTLKVGGEETLEVTLDENNGIAGIKTDLDAELQAQGLDGDVTVAVEGQSIVVTDARGRQLSDVALTDSDESIPATATVGGLSENAVELDLGLVEVTYTDANGDEQTASVEVGGVTSEVAASDITDNAAVAGDAASVVYEYDVSTLAEGDTLNVTLPASATSETAVDSFEYTQTGAYDETAFLTALNDDANWTGTLSGTFSVDGTSGDLVFTYGSTGEQTDLGDASIVPTTVETVTVTENGDTGSNPGTGEEVVLNYDYAVAGLAGGDTLNVTLPASATSETAVDSFEYTQTGVYDETAFLTALNDDANWTGTLSGTFSVDGTSGDLVFTYGSTGEQTDLDDAALTATTDETVDTDTGTDANEQFVEIDFAGNTVAEGDVLSVTVDGTEYTTTVGNGDTLANALAALGTAAEAETNVASSGVNGDVLTLTAAAGETFTVGGASVEDVSEPEVNDLAELATLLANSGEFGDFTIEAFPEDDTLVFVGNQDVTITSVSTLTQENGLQVGNAAVIADAIDRAANDETTIDLGDITVDNSEAAGNQALVGVDATVEAAGSEEGINASQVGGDALPTSADETPVNVVSTNYDPGVGENEGSDPIGTFEVTQEGTEATDGSPWEAELALVFFEDTLGADYTFSLTLTEADDANAITEFSVAGEEGDTLINVLDALVTEIDADSAFAAAIGGDDNDQLIITGEDVGVDYTLESDITLTGNAAGNIVEAA